MKERPILFSTTMVQAIQANRKDITRRTSGLEVVNAMINDVRFSSTFIETNGRMVAAFYCGDQLIHCTCPYGQVGDTLWVRETWAKADTDCGWSCEYGCVCPKYWYKAGGPTDYEIKWRPSIHMPRAACRLRLKIVSIRVERLHDITEEDAIREGIEPLLASRMQLAMDGQLYRHYTENREGIFGTGLRPRKSFETLWASINGQESWDQNPWVWRIQFEKI